MKPNLVLDISDREYRGSKRFSKDEARLARFGKRQQLQVCPNGSTVPTIYLMRCYIAKFRLAVRSCSDINVDDHLGGC